MKLVNVKADLWKDQKISQRIKMPNLNFTFQHKILEKHGFGGSSSRFLPCQFLDKSKSEGECSPRSLWSDQALCSK